MKNILLMTILLGTIACNGSGGGTPMVELKKDKIVRPHFADVECFDTETVTCEVITDDEGFELNRPELLVDHYSVEDFEIACEDSETLTTISTCNPVTTTNDIRAFETISQVQIIGLGAPLVYNSNEFEYRIAGAEDIGIIFKDKGELQGFYTYVNKGPLHYKWELQNDKLFIFTKDDNNVYAWVKVADTGFKVTRD